MHKPLVVMLDEYVKLLLKGDNQPKLEAFCPTGPIAAFNSPLPPKK